MIVLVQVYRARQQARYQHLERWNWRLFIDGERICTGDGYDTEEGAERIAQKVRELTQGREEAK